MSGETSIYVVVMLQSKNLSIAGVNIAIHSMKMRIRQLARTRNIEKHNYSSSMWHTWASAPVGPTHLMYYERTLLADIDLCFNKLVSSLSKPSSSYSKSRFCSVWRPASEPNGIVKYLRLITELAS